MPAGTCDPATRGQAFSVLQLAVANGDVMLTIRFGWDGVSVRPNCDGPLINGTGVASNRWAVQAQNLSQTTYYAHTIRKNGQLARYTLGPGATGNVTVAQASANGYTAASDFGSLSMSTDPNPPAELVQAAKAAAKG